MEISIYILREHGPEPIVEDLKQFDPTIESRIGLAEDNYNWIGLRKHHHDDKDNVIDMKIDDDRLPELIELAHTRPEKYKKIMKSDLLQAVYLRIPKSRGAFVQVASSTEGNLNEKKFDGYYVDYNL